MDVDKKEVAKKIEDGSYFSDAREWYYTKYLSPFTERSYLTVIFCVALLLAVTIYFNIHSLLPVYKKEPFIITSENTSDYYSVMYSLSTKNETPQEAITRYLINDYIMAREEFNPRVMYGPEHKKIVRKMKNLSERGVYRDYSILMSRTNPNSPFLRYRKNIVRYIDITGMNFIDKEKVIVAFTSTEKQDGKEIKKDKWLATVFFRLPDIKVIATTGAPLRFIVTHYEVKPAENNGDGN